MTMLPGTKYEVRRARRTLASYFHPHPHVPLIPPSARPPRGAACIEDGARNIFSRRPQNAWRTQAMQDAKHTAHCNLYPVNL